MGRFDPHSWDYRPPRFVPKLARRILRWVTRRFPAEERLSWSQDILVKTSSSGGVDTRRAVTAMEHTAHGLEEMGRIDEALITHENAHVQRMLHPDAIETLPSEMCLARMYTRAERYNEAASHFEHVAQSTKRDTDAGDYQYREALHWWGDSLTRAHRLEEGGAVLTDALVAFEGSPGITTERIQALRKTLASNLWEQGKTDSAITLWRQILAVYSETKGESDPDTLSALALLAAWTRWAGQEDEAHLLMHSYLEKKGRLSGEPDTDFTLVRKALDHLNRQRPQPEE